MTLSRGGRGAGENYWIDQTRQLPFQGKCHRLLRAERHYRRATLQAHEKAEGETHGLGSMTRSKGPNHDECGEKSSLHGGWRVKAWIQSNRVLRKGLVGKVAKALDDEKTRLDVSI